MTPERILAFWFAPRAKALWFDKNAAFDDEIRREFEATTIAAVAGELAAWTDTADGALALVIALDQFPRNMYRGAPAAFAHDPVARRIAAAAIERGFDLAVPLERQIFFYLPFQHAESLDAQSRGVALFERWADRNPPDRRDAVAEQLGHVRRHHEIIARFGRFPHRNAALGRASTPEEAAFLTEPRSSY